VQIPGVFECSGLIDGHPHVLAKSFGPGRHQIHQAEPSGLFQAFVETTMERAIAPARCLNFLHQDSKPVSIAAGDGVIDRYCDGTFFVLRDEGQIVQMIERGCVDAGF
jgi:hypothetical protein